MCSFPYFVMFYLLLGGWEESKLLVFNKKKIGPFQDHHFIKEKKNHNRYFIHRSLAAHVTNRLKQMNTISLENLDNGKWRDQREIRPSYYALFLLLLANFITSSFSFSLSP